MRIGHQIYNYLCDYTNDGKVTLAQPIVCIPNWPYNKSPSYIHGASIKWDEDQVYLLVVTGEIHTYMTINGFLKWMGGSQEPQNYKPLYKLRDVLNKFAKEVKKNWKHTSNIH